MKKYDKEYSTQYSPEKDYLLKWHKTIICKKNYR